MLIAPNDPNSSLPRITAREDANLNYAIIGLCTALFTFSVIAGVVLASGRFPAERAYLLMAPLPLALALWFAYGAFRARPLDAGLLLSCGGWIFALLTLLVKHATVQSALAAGTPLAQVTDSALSWMCALLSVILLGVGAYLSWQKVSSANSTI